MSISKDPLVDLFIAGVQKGGTTALDRLLRGHPGIRMATVKEPHFFDDDSVDWSNPNLAAYHSQFEVNADEVVVVGEATPILSYWPGAVQRIASYNPAARLILCLRHPTFRAYSHWRMETVRHTEELSFSEAIRAGRSRVSTAQGGVHRVFSYVERGFYADQIERVRGLFPVGNVLFLRTDRLWGATADIFGEVCSFLGIAGSSDRPTATYDVPIDSSAMGPIPAADRQYLDELFAADIRRTAELTSLDLSDWLDAAYTEPMRRGSER